MLHLNYCIFVILAGRNHLQDNNKNDEDAAQESTSKSDQAGLECERQCPERLEAEQSANSKEEALEGGGEDRLPSQPEIGTSCFCL